MGIPQDAFALRKPKKAQSLCSEVGGLLLPGVSIPFGIAPVLSRSPVVLDPLLRNRDEAVQNGKLIKGGNANVLLERITFADEFSVFALRYGQDRLNLSS